MIKKRMRLGILFSVIILMITVSEGMSQETVFALFKNDLKLADEYIAHNRYQNALDLYLNVEKKDQERAEIKLKIARCYAKLKQYEKAIFWYDLYVQKKSLPPLPDIYYYAEALAVMQNYEKAMEWYKTYLMEKPDDQVVIRKLWQMQNIHFLYEDSLHYAVRPAPFNTGYGELCATSYGHGLVFMSNRKGVQIIDNIDASSNAAFYRLYYTATFQDTANYNGLPHGEPALFNKGFTSKFHEGPVAFYNNEKSMVYVSSNVGPGKGGGRTLQLFFARQEEGRWKLKDEFPYNSMHYSICNPTISEDGKVLYFSSDMKGGLGGKDLYRSEYINNTWTKPVNLGDHINTPHDEVFPYLHQNNVLYFSSNGHAGLGGLDIFKAIIMEGGWSDVSNLGYPMNTNSDEFGIILDSLSTRGYFTSNRKQGGLDDDIYEFEMDVQTYPLVISGFVRSKEFSSSDSSELKPLPYATLYLIDNIRNVLVYENQSDSTGYFSLRIPYFSKYKIRVVGNDKEENIVSLEIPKHRKADGKHEIVVVKDPFRKHPNDIVK